MARCFKLFAVCLAVLVFVYSALGVVFSSPAFGVGTSVATGSADSGGFYAHCNIVIDTYSANPVNFDMEVGAVCSTSEPDLMVSFGYHAGCSVGGGCDYSDSRSALPCGANGGTAQVSIGYQCYSSTPPSTALNTIDYDLYCFPQVQGAQCGTLVSPAVTCLVWNQYLVSFPCSVDSTVYVGDPADFVASVGSLRTPAVYWAWQTPPLSVSMPASSSVQCAESATSASSYEFSASPPAVAGATVSSVTWNFGDGSSTFVGLVANHTYTGTSLYTVSADVAYSDGSNLSCSLSVQPGQATVSAPGSNLPSCSFYDVVCLLKWVVLWTFTPPPSFYAAYERFLASFNSTLPVGLIEQAKSGIQSFWSAAYSNLSASPPACLGVGSWGLEGTFSGNPCLPATNRVESYILKFSTVAFALMIGVAVFKAITNLLGQH